HLQWKPATGDVRLTHGVVAPVGADAAEAVACKRSEVVETITHGAVPVAGLDHDAAGAHEGVVVTRRARREGSRREKQDDTEKRPGATHNAVSLAHREGDCAAREPRGRVLVKADGRRPARRVL